jgi:conjugative transfer signal peptidase TraF
MRHGQPICRAQFRRAALAVGTLLVGTLATAWVVGLRINDTASMPRGVWQVSGVDAPLRRGQIVTVCLPGSAPVREAAARGYAPAGTCASGIEPLIKPVAAIAGDVVTVTTLGVVVNGRLVDGTTQLAKDSAGRPLRPVQAGVYPVLPGQVWLLSGHDPRSFDSRYLGPIPTENVQGVARPLWVFG